MQARWPRSASPSETLCPAVISPGTQARWRRSTSPRPKIVRCPASSASSEILDDCFTLKEQRIVGQEKQRVEAVLRGIHEAVQAYRSDGFWGSVFFVAPLLEREVRGREEELAVRSSCSSSRLLPQRDSA